jgi:hypothetical protein
MTEFDPVFRLDARTGPTAVPLVRAKLHAWIDSPWLRDLVEISGGGVHFEGSLDDIVAELETFSDRWDFRRIARERGAASDDRVAAGAARWLSAETGLTATLEARVMKAVEHLGLVQSGEPQQASYDSILVLGGGRLSCALRPLRAAELVRSGLDIRRIGLLGAARPVADSERDATDTYAPGAVDEFDLIVAGAEKAFGFDITSFSEERHDDSNRNSSWVVRRFEAPNTSTLVPLIAVSAPSSEPDRRRANSADTIVFFLDHEHIPSGSSLLLITSQIYVPYVQLEALRTVAIPRGLVVETLGFPGRDRMPELQGMSNPNHYLQEVRSAIQAARRFCQAYPE